jgi:uncharacterized protein YwgA
MAASSSAEVSQVDDSGNRPLAMNDLDDAALKAEIDQISQKIDAIMERVERLYPSRQKPAEQDNTASEDKPLPPQEPSG